eukprot:TRINITY_DN7145_c0_g1_i1.p1 TRINITY_DN7145_c0_g1~~TRINITY_DN7145_c0_g1_i1.p1  ORF type:complete len:485 (+),score=103.23 TRINITY_DN7145_c0_g1_i1:3-1457(+)
MTDVLQLANFIDGSFAAPSTGAYIDSVNPATAELYAKVPDSNKTDVELAVQAGLRAFPKWAAVPRAERARFLNKIADGIEARLDEFAVAESRDQGKPVSLAKSVDIPRACANFRFYAGAILHHEEMSTDMDGTVLNYSVSQPIGVAGLISPWNLPLYLLTWKIAPAIAVGNTCVCKPSEFTSVTAWLMCQVIQQVGLPPGVVNIVFGDGPKVGSNIASHPKIPLISFTGSTATGEKIAMAAAPFNKKLSLELGGKNANIIFDDADLSDCIPTTVRSSFSNQGEICLCGSRIFVQRGIYDRFLSEFVAAASKIVVGDPSAPSTNMGALNTKMHMDKVLSYIAIAKADGATFALGGEQPKLDGPFANGYFVGPTILTGLSPDSRCCQEEIFGPVVTVVPFDSEDEAVALANNVQYGLSASVWTTNVGRAHRVAGALQCGYVWVNCWMLRDLRVPFGGTKASGVGREGGKYSIEFYTEQKTVCLKYA